MTSNKTNLVSPYKYLSRKGRTYTEVIALKSDIREWLDNGYDHMAIYKLLMEKKAIDCQYRTFLKAVNKMLEKESPPVTQFEESPQEPEDETAEYTQSSLLPFAFGDALVRVAVDELGDPWFVAKDVCDVLGLGNSRDAVSRLDEDEKADVGITDTSSNGVTQRRSVNIVSESGLYALVFTSRKPQARAFRKWVTAQVLPTIRRTGRYEGPPASPRSAECAPDPGESAQITAQVLSSAVQAAQMGSTGPEAIEDYFRRFYNLVFRRNYKA